MPKTPSISFVVCALVAPVCAADRPDAAGVEFFESRIRPVLVEQCYKCHNSAETAEGGLAVDSRSAFLKGGDNGKIIVPGKPGESRLLPILRHEVAGQKMPQNSGKLDARVVADFAKWIAMGAPDPRDKPPSAAELKQATSWEATLKRRKQWWSFQPIRNRKPPGDATAHQVDSFVAAKLKSKGLKPNGPADSRTLIRRLYFALIGLPPSPADVEKWSGRITANSDAVEQLVDELLASRHFGERWARHWMDWIRYAESHGSEGDPGIDNAWMYRDYLIRALNADVPCDQLVREHVAGDLLKEPRINEKLGINESAIGPAHWRMVFHGFAPTDALDEKVRFTDDQINAFSKAFLGLTVSCARCHNHKFDAISQADYYALFGILGSGRPGRTVIDLPDRRNLNRDKLAALKPRIRTAIADAWLDSAAQVKKRLLADDGLWKNAKQPQSVLHPWYQLRNDDNAKTHFTKAWERRIAAWNKERGPWREHQSREYAHRWQLGNDSDYQRWFPKGTGLPQKPHRAGEFSVSLTGDAAIAAIYPAGVFSHALSSKHAARLTSPAIQLDGEYDLWIRVIGSGGATMRYVVQNYPRNGTVYPVASLGGWRWQRYNLNYWNGDEIHIEITAGKDAPLLVRNDPRSWFGVREAVLVRKGQPAPVEPREFLDPLFAAASKPPKSFEELADVYTAALKSALAAWRTGKTTDAQAALLSACVKQGLLPNRLDQLPAARLLIAEYRRLENEIPVPTRVPGIDETVGRDQPLFERGNHKRAGDRVPRRFLEAIDATPYKSKLSGRRQLAEDLLRDDNPLTRRVIVNRVWHHLFGRGIVATPDNFGKLGAQPTHPELLDYLAVRFQRDGWSLKKLIRLIVTSSTWRQSSQPSTEAVRLDPGNRWLSHAQVRRLEAEAIRDSLLAVSGRLDLQSFGPPVDGGSARRSVYVQVRRNSLDPFLRAFDFPEPFSSTGRRDVTNVPAQSLTLMNDPRIVGYATAWAESVLAEKNVATRIRRMFVQAFGRPPSDAEVAMVRDYLAETVSQREKSIARAAELRGRVQRLRADIRRIVDPVRKRLRAEAETAPKIRRESLPQPIARWEFDRDLRDSAGQAHVSAKGAKLSGGALVVNRGGYAITVPLKHTLRAKTLEVWVQLDNLNQRGGGAMAVQTPDGRIFDAIVFGEKDAGQWMAGSNFFARTQSFAAPRERDAVKRAVHVAIAYHADGRIVGYRDGKPYGRAYKSNGPQVFEAGRTVVGFCIRHLPAGGNRMLSGRIVQARLYDRALSADEVAASFGSLPGYVSEAQIRKALGTVQRAQIDVAEQQIEAFAAKLAALGDVPKSLDEKTVWTDLARTMFTFKEFIYVR